MRTRLRGRADPGSVARRICCRRRASSNRSFDETGKRHRFCIQEWWVNYDIDDKACEDLATYVLVIKSVLHTLTDLPHESPRFLVRWVSELPAGSRFIRRNLDVDREHRNQFTKLSSTALSGTCSLFHQILFPFSGVTGALCL